MKKIYVKPEVQEVLLDTKVSLLSGSGETMQVDTSTATTPEDNIEFD